MELRLDKISPINSPSSKYIKSGIAYDLLTGDERFIFSNLSLGDFDLLYISVKFLNVAAGSNSKISMIRSANSDAPESEYVPVPGSTLSIDTGAVVINDFNFTGFSWNKAGVFFDRVGGTTGTLDEIIVEVKKQM